MHHGITYTISCDALDCPRTKQDSWRQANEWWEHQFTKIREPSCRFDDVLEELARRKSWLLHHGLDTAGIDQTITLVRTMASDDLHPSIAQEITAPNASIWQDRLSRFKPTPTNKTVGY